LHFKGKSRLLNWFAGFSFSAKAKKVALLQLKKKNGWHDGLQLGLKLCSLPIGRMHSQQLQY